MSESTARLSTALADRYKIERRLGEGGMATVYLARDLKHEREVAVKVLRPELAASLGPERFLREIKITAQLNHPHILPLLDSGDADGFLFYVMPYVEGESLRDRLNREKQLPIEDAIKIASEVADGLESAHKRDVVHRDVKPENILLEEGHAVVADFGIARAIHVAGGETLTQTGMAVGTPAYMSPEQAAGSQELDGRSDIYGLGCVLYEMLAGQAPFTGPTVESIVRQHLIADAPSVAAIRETVPREIADAIQRVMAKAPADRFATASEFADALKPAATTLATGAVASATFVRRRRVGIVAAAALLALAAVAWGITRIGGSAGGPGDTPRLVVLPFENLSGSEEEYFADGMTEEITAKMANVSGLLVIARQTAIQYEGSGKSAREIGEELDADYVLAGTVRTDRTPDGRGQVRITPQLIRASDETQLWVEPYTVDLVVGEIFRIQVEIAARIARGMDVVLLGPEQEAIAARPTGNLEAYDYYLRGLSYTASGSALRRIEDYRLAGQMFETATELDADYVEAFAAQAQIYARLFQSFYQIDAGPKAKAAAERAAELAPDHPASHAALGFYFNQVANRGDLAERHFAAARQAQPNDITVLSEIAGIQRRRGDFEGALANYREILDLSPRHESARGNVGRTYYAMRRYPEAKDQFDRHIALFPDSHWGHFFNMMLYLTWDGSTERAGRAFDAAFAKTDLLRFLLSNWDFDDAMVLRVFSDRLDEALFRRTLVGSPDDSAAYYLAKADASTRRGRADMARAYHDSARVVLKGRLEVRPDHARDLSALSLAYAELGQVEAARRAGERAVELALEQMAEWPRYSDAGPDLFAHWGLRCGYRSTRAGVVRSVDYFCPAPSL